MSVFHSRAVLPDIGGGERRAAPRPTRGTRVILLTIALVAMSLVDLYITLLYLESIGLAEANPLARLVMAEGSPGLLTAWKLVTLLPALLVLVIFRRRFSAELLAWVGCVVLALVTVRWGEYANQTDLILLSLPALEDGVDERWVTAPDR